MNVIHLLLLKARPEATPQQIQAAFDALTELQQKIPGILDVQMHTSLKADKQSNFTNLVIFTFENEERFAAYGPHPAHQALIREHIPLFSSVFSFDYLQDQNAI